MYINCMVRKQIYITDKQEAYLKSQSIKEAELIRRALDEYIKRNSK